MSVFSDFLALLEYIDLNICPLNLRKADQSENCDWLQASINLIHGGNVKLIGHVSSLVSCENSRIARLVAWQSRDVVFEEAQF